jgi:hypothetical protein
LAVPATIAVAPVWATIAPALVQAIARLEFPIELGVVIALAIVVSAIRLRWEIAADLAAGRAATAEAVLVPAPVAAHRAWEVTAAVVADMVAAVCAVVVCAAAEAAGGKHHEHSKSARELHDFEAVLAKTLRNRRDGSSAAHLGADLLVSCRCTDKITGDS